MTFLPGLDLAERFYREAVRPLLEVPHAAALIGPGSEVLGFDTGMSTDHDWGPRLLLFLDGPPPDFSRLLPKRFLGWSTHFAPPDPDDNGTRLLADTDGPVDHRVECWTVDGFITGLLGTSTPDEIDWLTFPQQVLRSLMAGRVFHDDLGLEDARARFRWYPRDAWLYQLACGWQRIGQEDHLMGRAGFVGDEVGAGVIAGRLVRDAMRLCFLMERTYAPYPKWLGTAFARLECAPGLLPSLREALRAETWQEREEAMCGAWRVLGEMHNALGITAPIPPEPMPFFGRPFRVIGLRRHADAIAAAITSPTLRALPRIGAIDQWSDSTDLLGVHRRARALYEA